jgi:hypothetical protein
MGVNGKRVSILCSGGGHNHCDCCFGVPCRASGNCGSNQFLAAIRNSSSGVWGAWVMTFQHVTVKMNGAGRASFLFVNVYGSAITVK